MDYRPASHYLSSMLNSNIGWHDALSEMIDNSFDAKASSVRISLTKDGGLTVKDDGRGCDDIAPMAQLGKHAAHSTTALGMHGRGLKDAWTYIGDRMIIDSVRDNVRRTLDVSVSALMENDWVGPDPKETIVDDAEPGTIIRFPCLHKERRPWRESTINDLRKTFMPALLNGLQIVIGQRRKRIALKAFSMPPLTDRVREMFQCDNRDVTIDIGIVPPGEPNPNTGFLFTYGHRTIMESALGAKEYSTARLTGVVQLGKGWRLNPNKTAVVGDTDALEQAIFDRICLIAQKAHQQSQVAKTEAFKLEVEEYLADGLNAAKEKRTPEDSPHRPPSVPKNTGRRRRKAKKSSEDPGSVTAPRKRHGITIDVQSLGADEVVGKADPKMNKVCLNYDHPFVADNWQKNREAIAAAAFGVFVHQRCRESHPLFIDQEFVGAWSRVLVGTQESGGRDAKQA